MKLNRLICLLLGLLSFIAESNASVQAGFTPTPPQGCSPLVVKFVNISVNATSYKWDFGNGNGSSLKDPSAIYYVPGKYTVTLIAKDNAGNSDTFRYKDITVFKNPQARFSLDKKEICEGQMVNFSDKSIEGDTSISVYSYDFGNGKVKTDPNGSVVYSSSGTFSVGLYIIDRNGCESDTLRRNLLKVKPNPVSNFSQSDSQFCALPGKVDFTNQSSQATPHQYRWHMGDGSVLLDKDPSHTYTKYGTYNPELIVISSNGCRDTFRRNSPIVIQPLRASFKPKGSLCGPATIQFQNLTPSNFPGITFRWDIDGKILTTTDASAYLGVGNHKVKLVAYSGSCFDDTTINIVITPRPKGKILFNPEFICELPTQISARFSDSTLDNSWNYSWYDIDSDQKIGSGKKYNGKVRDSTVQKFRLELSKQGCTASFSDSIQYSKPGLVIEPDSSGCVPMTITFKSTTHSRYEIVSYKWNFGDGSTSDKENPQHTFDKPDKYKVQLVITDINGCTATDYVDIKTGVKIPPLFTMDTSAVCNGDTIHFVNKTDEDPYTPGLYIWGLKDLNTGETKVISNQKDSFDYKVKLPPGHHRGFLISVHNDACRDTFFYPDSVRVKAPLAMPVVISDSCGPTDVIFVNESIDETSFVWLDPAPLRGSSAERDTLFMQPGDYKAAIAAYSSKTGCHDTTSKPFTIKSGPEVKLLFDGDLNCPPIQLSINGALKSTGNFVLTVNGEKERMYGVEGKPWTFSKTYSDLPSQFMIKYYADNFNECVVEDSFKMEGNGPKSKGSLSYTGKCLPYSLNLYDSTFGKDTFDHYWIVGDQAPIKVTSATTSAKLFTKRSGEDSASIRLKVGNGKCYDIKDIKIPVYGFSAELDLWQTDVWCDEVVYYFKAIAGTNDTTEYQWGVNDHWPRDFGPLANFAARRPLNDETDTVKLRMRSKAGCEAEITQLLVKPEPTLIPDIAADVTGSECPPLMVNFKDKTKSKYKLVSWEWQLGDSATSDLQNPQRIFLEPGTFSITLKVRDETGCERTITYPDFITVEGPKAELFIFPKEGCAPHTVNFRGSSPDSVTYTWDLGDGNLSTEREFKHTYNDPGRYIPLLTVADTLGCEYTLPPRDTILVTRLPEPEIQVNGHCAQDAVDIYYVGSPGEMEPSDYYWDLGDGNLDTGAVISHIYQKGGTYTVSLKTVNEQGCTQSAQNQVSITGGNPGFMTDRPGTCIGDSIEVSFSGDADNPFNIYRWLVDSLSLNHTNNRFIVKSDEAKIFDISVTILTNDGCYFSYRDSTGAVFGDDTELGMAEIRRVSVENDYEISVRLNPDNDPFTAQYKYYLSGPSGQEISNGLWDRATTDASINGLTTTDSFYCFVVSRVNYCGTSSEPDRATQHCTVEVKATGDSACNKVRWTPYHGWQNVDHYDVLYRPKNAITDFAYLASVQGDIVRYTDSITSCDAEREYRIQAFEMDGFNETSFSDTAIAKPRFGFEVKTPEVWRASVENDEFIILEWLKPQNGVHPVDTLELFRMLPDGSWETWSFLTPDYIDTSDLRVKVDESSYLYSLRARDTCQNWSARSNKAKTVLLKVGFDKENYVPVLSWSAYEEWEEGVDHYIVERRVGPNAFVKIGKVPATNELAFTDHSARSNCSPEYCYRITAVRNPIPDTSAIVISHSNVDCADVISHLYVPNAFTMNQDGLNETFQPVGLYISKYQIQVFNRWGQLLFESDQCMAGWDGTYLDTPCQVDAYMYKINAVGADGRAFNLSGSFHLLK